MIKIDNLSSIFYLSKINGAILLQNSWNLKQIYPLIILREGILFLMPPISKQSFHKMEQKYACECRRCLRRRCHLHSSGLTTYGRKTAVPMVLKSGIILTLV